MHINQKCRCRTWKCYQTKKDVQNVDIEVCAIGRKQNDIIEKNKLAVKKDSSVDAQR